jgi:hypothetical protein
VDFTVSLVAKQNASLKQSTRERFSNPSQISSNDRSQDDESGAMGSSEYHQPQTNAMLILCLDAEEDGGKRSPNP